jgi:hypothetical protein
LSALAFSVAPVVVMSTMRSVLFKIAPRGVHIFGGDAQPTPMSRAKTAGDIGEIGHAAHVDPRRRNRDDDIGGAKTQRRQQFDAVRRIVNLLAHKILAGDAEMRLAARQPRGDFRRRQKRRLDMIEPGDGPAIIARAAPLLQLQPGPREKGEGVLLQPALGRHGDDQAVLQPVLALRPWRPQCLDIAHAASPERRSIEMAAPTAGMSRAAPSVFSSVS